MGERQLCKLEVTGSIPVISTILLVFYIRLQKLIKISPLYKRGNSFFDNTDLGNKGEPSIKRTILSRLKMVKLLRAYVWMTWHE